MRAVDRGTHPVDAVTGAPVAFTHYRDAAPYLHERLGRYCSYCERKIPVGLAVEHILPKLKAPEQALSWDNLLLACANCNSTKRDQYVERHACLWPDTDDTFAVFEYRADGGITVKTDLSDTLLTAKAATLLTLVGLDKGSDSATQFDYRAKDRREQWGKAHVALNLFENLTRTSSDQASFRHLMMLQISEAYSIWATVFRHDAVFLEALAAKFPGTRRPV
jgi:uncharacterized protein (TIGR02646 family)